MDKMDKQLELYFNNKTEINPPYISEQKIQRILETRKKRNIMIAISFAALLWAAVFAVFSVWIHQFNPLAAYIIAGVIGVGYISSGIFSGIVLKFKKAGV